MLFHDLLLCKQLQALLVNYASPNNTLTSHCFTLPELHDILIYVANTMSYTYGTITKRHHATQHPHHIAHHLTLLYPNFTGPYLNIAQHDLTILYHTLPQRHLTALRPNVIMFYVALPLPNSTLSCPNITKLRFTNAPLN